MGDYSSHAAELELALPSFHCLKDGHEVYSPYAYSLCSEEREQEEK